MILDRFVPAPLVRERHELMVHAPADVVWAVARDLDLFALPLVRGIFRLRALVMRAGWPARTPRGFFDEMRGMGWGVLDEVPDRRFVAGAACQPWRGDVTFVPVAAPEFAAWTAPAMVKIAWTLETTPLGPTRTILATETRVQPTDAEAGWRFGRYWLFVRPGIVLVRRLLLRAVCREAQRRWGAMCRESMAANAPATAEPGEAYAGADVKW